MWHDIIGNSPLADAVLDQSFHGAYLFKLDGDVMRKRTLTGDTDKRSKLSHQRRYAVILWQLSLLTDLFPLYWTTFTSLGMNSSFSVRSRTTGL